jgi:hypothetical protein
MQGAAVRRRSTGGLTYIFYPAASSRYSTYCLQLHDVELELATGRPGRAARPRVHVNMQRAPAADPSVADGMWASRAAAGGWFFFQPHLTSSPNEYFLGELVFF